MAPIRTLIQSVFLTLRQKALVASLCAIALAGCDGLLDAELPGAVLDNDLNNPSLARLLAHSARGDMECSYAYYSLLASTWSGENYLAGDGTGELQFSIRSQAVTRYGATTCDGPRNSIAHPWTPLHIARVAAETGIRRVEAFPTEIVSAEVKDFLVGDMYAQAGYATLLLSESHCELAFDSGPLQTRAQGFQRAVDLFTSSLEHANRVTSGPDAAQAALVRNLARVGRARANLNLGNSQAVIDDASQVTEGFVWNAERSPTSPRQNQFFQARNTYIPRPEYHNLTVDGVPDPRVAVTFTTVGLIVRPTSGLGSDNRTPWAGQLKYPTQATAHRMASWREARLMIAEAAGGETAVAEINRLRATFNLPPFSSSDPNTIAAQVLEERRRELWLEGTRLGDMLRHQLPFPTGQHPRGISYPAADDRTCIPMPDQERQSNPNVPRS